MGWQETAKDLSFKIADLLKELFTVQARVEGVKETVDRTREDQKAFIDQTKQDIRDIQKDVDEIRRRLARIEGLIDSVMVASTKEAIIQLAREHQDQHGSLDNFSPLKMLDENKT